jgi:hypothetical protein
MGAGPFPLRAGSLTETNSERLTSSAKRTRILRYSAKGGLQVLPQEDGSDETFKPPARNYDCGNYETCLGLAAALNWSSFTCEKCSGAVNEQLLWRAHHKLRNNPSLSKLCGLPTLGILDDEQV